MDISETAVEGAWQAWPVGKEGNGMCFLVARDGRIIGADRAFHFGGEYRFTADIIEVTFSSKRYADGNGMTIWGGHEGQTLVLKGTYHPMVMDLSGHFAGERDGTTQVSLRKLIDWGR